MELSISKQDFLRGLTRTHSVADRRNSMPILSNVSLSDAGGDGLRLAATDLYLGATTVVPAEIRTGGKLALSAKTLFNIVRALPDGEVTLTAGDNHAAEIRCGKVSYKIPGMPGEDFPPLPNPGDAAFNSIPVDILAELISLTSYSMSTDDTRPHLSGSLFEGEGTALRMVTTDGHRLSKAEHQVEGKSYEFKMLVPHKGVGELKRALEDAKGGDGGEIEVASAAGHAFFRHGETLLSVKLADEQFPPYAKVIPQKQGKVVVTDRGGFIEALKRISLVAADKSGGVQLHLEEGQVRIQSQNPDVGEGHEELPVDYAGESLSIGFNAKYLLDAFSALKHDEVRLELNGELDPGVVRPSGDGVDYVGVVMPMRI